MPGHPCQPTIFYSVLLIHRTDEAANVAIETIGDLIQQEA